MNKSESQSIARALRLAGHDAKAIKARTRALKDETLWVVEVSGEAKVLIKTPLEADRFRTAARTR